MIFIIKEKKSDIYIFISFLCFEKKNSFVTFFLIFKFILIYFLDVLFVFKIESIFGKRKSQPRKTKKDYFLYESC